MIQSLSEFLIFSDDQFGNLLKNGWGMPKIGGLLSPCRSFCILSCLWKIGNLYKVENGQRFAPLLLGGSLEAICTYMNSHCEAGRVFESEKDSSIFIRIAETGSEYFICYDSPIGWSLKHVQRESSIQAPHLKASNCPKGITWKTRFLLALSMGDILLAGRIPMLEKFGYVARIAQREIPPAKMNKRKQSELLFKRANHVIPNGIYGHVAPGPGYLRIFLIIACPNGLPIYRCGRKGMVGFYVRIWLGAAWLP